MTARSAGTPDAFHVTGLFAASGARRALRVPRGHPGWAPGAQRPGRGAGRRRRGVPPEWALRGGPDDVIDNHTLVDHAVPALHEPRALQGHPRRPLPRRLPRAGDRAARRPEDRRRSSRTRTCCSRDGAEIDTKPQLEIYADDVKCSHGSTIGQLDAKPLFYLRARGIGDEQARRLLVAGFAAEILREPAGRGPGLDADGASCASGCVRPVERRRERMSFDVERIRKQFPILDQQIHGKPLVYLDSAASAQKPRAVIDAMVAPLLPRLRQRPPRRLRALRSAPRARSRPRARRRAASSAPPRRARSSSCAAPPRPSTWSPRAAAAQHVGEGDEVLITHMEHHSNIVPWQMLCEREGREAARGPDRRRRRPRPRRRSRRCWPTHPARRRDATSRTRSAP